MPHSKTTKKTFRPGSIGEFKQRGGKLPGEKGVTSASLRNQLRFQRQAAEQKKQKAEQIKRANALPRGKEAIAGFEKSALETAPSPNELREKGVEEETKRTLAVTEPKIELKDIGGAALTSISVIPVGRTINVAVRAATAAARLKTIAKFATVGKSGIVKNPSNTAETFAVNSKTIETTKRWFEKIFTTNKKVISTNLKTGKITEVEVKTISGPKVILVASAAGLLISAITSYPFAGFITEEALQTIRGSMIASEISGDLDLAQRALDERNAVLDIQMERGIIEKIPIKNVVDALKGLFSTARVAADIDQERINNKRIQLEKGETDEEMWARINEKRIEDEKAMVKFRRMQRVLQVRWERESEVAGRDDDARFWARQRQIQRDEEAADRQAMADFWQAYKKADLEIQNAARPESLAFSKLNFGLI